MMDICAWYESSGECAIYTILDQNETVYCMYCGCGCGKCERYVKDAG